MSTVLEALREQQRSRVEISQPVTPPRYRTRRPRAWLIAALAVTVLLVLVVAIRLVDARRAATTVPPAALPQVQTAPAQPAAAAAPAAPVSSAAQALLTTDLPHGVAEKVAPPAKPVTVPKTKREAPALHRRMAATEQRTAPEPALPGSGGVQLKSVRYSADATKRSATLVVGAETATLREGQSIHGIEVQLILPDRVYVREGGSVSAITSQP